MCHRVHTAALAQYDGHASRLLLYQPAQGCQDNAAQYGVSIPAISVLAASY